MTGTGRPMITSRWSAIVGFGLVASANQLLWLNFTPITSGAATRLHVTQSDIGLLSEIFPLLYVLLAVPIGRALDRWFRPALLGGALLNGIGAVVRLFGHGYLPLLLGQILVAVAQPAILNAITGTASRYLAERHRPTGIAAGSAATFVGFVTAFALGGIWGAAGLRTILDISAAYAVIAAVVACATLRHPVNGAARRARAARPIGAPHPSAAVAGTGDPPTMRQLWADPVLRLLAALVFLGFGVFIAVTTWAETLLKPVGVHAGTTDTLLAVMVLAGVVGCAVIPPAPATSKPRSSPFRRSPSPAPASCWPPPRGWPAPPSRSRSSVCCSCPTCR